MTVASGVMIVDDAVSDALAEVGAALGQEGLALEVLRLTDFVRQEGFEFDGETAVLRRVGQSGRTGSQRRRVLDRVVEISPYSLSRFDGGEGLLRRGQLSSAYEALLAEKGCAPADDAAYSTVGKLLPLPSQWRIVSRAFSEVSIPSYKHGYGPEVVPSEDFRNPIFKTPFDLYSWKANERPEGAVMDQFIVDAPEGTPILSYFLGSNVTVSSLRAETELDPELVDSLSKLTLRMAQLFRAEVGEILWFVDGDEVVFAAFSHFLAAARRHEPFAEGARCFLRDFLSSEA